MEILLLVGGLLLVSLPFLNSWRKRARRRRELRGLLKDGFRLERSFVRNNVGLATNEEEDVFAVSFDTKSGAFKGADIREVTLGSIESGQSLRLELRSLEIPSIRADTYVYLQRQREIAARLKAMAAASQPATLGKNASETDTARLERAIRGLTGAMEELTAAAKGLRPTAAARRREERFRRKR